MMSLAQSQVLAGNPVVSRQCNRRPAQRARFVPRAEFELAPPPYEMDALEPAMSKNTFDFHWGKHHRAYVNNLNGQIKGTPMENKTLEEIIVESYNGGDPTPVFNNAAQSWNHTFFWESMTPDGGAPSGDLAAAIDRDLGGFDQFKADFSAAGATQFGSGWAWLVSDSEGKLSIVKTPNAVNPMALGCGTAILTMDVWEHAYYLDFQNNRPGFIESFVTKLINWDKVAERYAAAQK